METKFVLSLYAKYDPTRFDYDGREFDTFYEALAEYEAIDLVRESGGCCAMVKSIARYEDGSKVVTLVSYELDQY